MDECSGIFICFELPFDYCQTEDLGDATMVEESSHPHLPGIEAPKVLYLGKLSSCSGKQAWLHGLW